MRYLDTASRDPQRAAGSWLANALTPGKVAALRLQSGFVGPEPLGYLESALRDLAAVDGETSILVGSNGGETARETIEDLLLLTGPQRPNLRLGVVSFSDGFFHPKVYHVLRTDGSMAAYVGSANFTYAGISGKNIEAGIALDTNDGDHPSVLIDILDAIDEWFAGQRPGFFPVRTGADLPQLVADGVLGVPRRPKKAARTTAGAGTAKVVNALRGLLRMPAIARPMVIPPAAPVAPAPAALTATPPLPSSFVESWSKTLPSSDAQRKPDGNQSGVIVLTQADRRGQIDQTKYFRNDLFGGLLWQQAPTRTGHMMDVAQVQMHTTVLGRYLGVLTYEVSHDNGRESRQNNYTAKLSLGPIRAEFDRVNMTGRKVEVGRDSAGEYWLDIN